MNGRHRVSLLQPPQINLLILRLNKFVLQELQNILEIPPCASCVNLALTQLLAALLNARSVEQAQLRPVMVLGVA